jgi:hypothetical protein
MITMDRGVALVGYQARGADGTVIGIVEGVRPHGVRIYKIPGHPGHHGYLPAEAIERVEDSTNTIVLVAAATIDAVLDAPPPPDESPDGWHTSNDWWADLLGHYRLFASEGRKSEPFLHPDQR